MIYVTGLVIILFAVLSAIFSVLNAVTAVSFRDILSSFTYLGSFIGYSKDLLPFGEVIQMFVFGVGITFMIFVARLVLYGVSLFRGNGVPPGRP